MQYMTQYINMMKVAFLIAQMPVGEGWTIAKDYTQWTELSRATVYRRLQTMAKEGLLQTREHKKGKRVYYSYRLTEKGKALYESQKVMFNY